MTEPGPIAKAELLGQLPPIWPDPNLRSLIQDHLRTTHGCVAVLDDDPTGTQTVHEAWVVCRPGSESLRDALQTEDPALFILTKSRSLPEAEAGDLNRRLGRELLRVAKSLGRPLQLVSRSDSTLRGHFPAETDALCEIFRTETGAGVDGVILVPFFAEAGRYTIGDVQWVEQGELLFPAGQTAFAQDPSFGYQASSLPQYVEEKSRGRLRADSVLSIPVECLRKGGPQAVAQKLLQAGDRQIVVVNAAHERDVEVLVVAVLAAEARGKHFLYRSASSLVKVAAGMLDRPLLTRTDLLTEPSCAGGLIIFGSIVPQSIAQLDAVLRMEDLAEVELDVSVLIDPANRAAMTETAARAVDDSLASGRDVVLCTSRLRMAAATPEEGLRIARSISSGLCEVIASVRQRPRYLLGKGGITASDLATQACRVDRARVLGQVMPGVSVWRLGPEARWPDLPFIVFPGNVGGDDAVAELVRQLRA